MSMKPKKKNQEYINDVAITIEVGSGTIDRVRKGETTHISVQINSGEFPDAINDSLRNIKKNLPQSH